MASTVNQQQPFPAAPPSLSAGDHEMRNYYAPQDAPRPAINQTPYLKPHLGLRARLSQIWANKFTILLLLVLVRLLFAIGSANTSLASARREALSACTQVENIGSSMASMPHFAAQGVNEMTAAGVEKAVSGLMTMLDMSVTGVEEIVVFVVHMMTSTYLCLITLAVRGSVGAAVDLGNEISQNLNKTIEEVTGEMGDATKKVTDGINEILNKVSGLPFSPDFSPPSIDLSSQIQKLQDLRAPPELQQGLQELNNSIPTFEEVQNFTDSVIRLPFEEVKKLIAGFDTFEFDRQLLPVPQKEQLNFCSEDNAINEFFDDLAALTNKARKIGLITLILAALVVIAPMAWAEQRRYHRQEERAQLFKHGHDEMDVVYLASRPHSSTIGLWLGRRFGSVRRQSIIRWAWAYATSVPMLFILSLALAGLFSCLCQYLLVRGMQQKAPELTDKVANFAEKVVTSLNNASMSWSGGVNNAIGDLDNKINGDILGWVNTTTSAVNDTLNTFVEKTSDTLDKAFGDSPLKGPIKDVLNCLIGLKIAAFQKGLTWVQDHAHVQFPGVANDTLSLGTLAKASNSSSAAALLADPNGKTRDEITEAIEHVVEQLMSGIRTEALISTVLLLLWLAVAIGGFVYAATQLFRKGDFVSSTGNAYIINPALADNMEKGHEHPNTAAPPYEYPVNKAAPYTLQPRPFQTYESSDNGSPTEKVGQVESHPVADSARPGHLRASSHGHLATPSPADDHPLDNPFLNSNEKKRDPFRDY